ncbi:MAG: LamG domain-containing protein [Candidatus Sungbacteria bacterium]|nr:LamG domain-containing protein [bacterium]MDZ4285505.1 LamG domain-containing protein [Candidatus Sungbacteria bacterium]
MNIQTRRTSKLLALGLLVFSFLLSLTIVHVQAASNDSSINIKQDLGGDLYTLTIRDPDGIQEFSLSLVGRYNYGGGLSSCPKSFSSNNISFVAPSDFTPVMPAYVIDCKNNKTELEIPPPVKGVTNGVVAKKETPLPPPPPPKEEKKEEKKEGPLSAEDIQYPVQSLGSCQNEIECRSYCDNTNRAKECFAFAKKYNLISPEEAKKAADNFLNVTNGPGGCNSGASCEAYCSNVDHLDACIVFAEENDYYSSDELAEAKKFQALIKAGKQFPGGCKDRNACEIYCSDSNHMEECLNFAEESGFMPKEEIEEARKILPMMKRGETPGKCTSKEQCETYCLEESHSDECIAFGEKAGLISPEDAAVIKKTGGKGPGGCRSKQQCEAYCESNSDACFQWAQDNGLVSPDDLSKMKKGMVQFKEQLDKMPPEVTQCLKDNLGEKNFDKMVNGQPIFDRSMEGKMKSCFSELTSQVSKQFNTLPPEASQCIKDVIGEEGLRKLQSGEVDQDFDFSSLEGCFQKMQSSFGTGPGGPGGSTGFSGPGGCKSIDECTAHCQSNPDACKDFAPPGGGTPGGGSFGGPGGCTSQEECMSYCKDHPEECKNFSPPSGGGSPGEPQGLPSSSTTGGSSGGTSGSFSGPGGCASQEQCMAYCQSHYQDQECQKYIGGSGTGSGTQSCVQAPSGLVSRWSADMVSGTGVADMSNGNNGTIVGGVTIVPIDAGSAFKFDGSSGHISMGNPGSLNFGTGPFSLEGRFHWDGSGNSGALNIIRKSNYPVTGPGAGYWLRIGKESKIIEFSVGATTGPEGQSIITGPISSGAWHHVVATRDGSGVVTLYVDGKSEGVILRQATNADSTSEAPFTLGAWNDRFGITELFPGTIDEISVYNRALSASEVQGIFDAGSAGKCSTNGGTNPEPYQEPTPTYVPQTSASPQHSQPPDGSSYEIPITPEICANFTSVPSCSYVGSPDSQNYQLCKKCYPDK